MSITVKIQVPGTTANCGPGFDAVGIACSIYNDIELTLTDNKKLTIELSGEGREFIPRNEQNIVWQAICTVFSKIGYRCQGAHIKMHNHIPLSRGLGSSAAAIVSGLMAANAVTGMQLTKNDILDLATAIEGHPDNVAPAIFGGITLSIVEDSSDKHAHYLRFIPPSPLNMIVAVPDFILSTKSARRVLPEVVPHKDAAFNVGRTALLVGALCQGEFSLLKQALEDKLHQPYRRKLITGMDSVFSAAMEKGALGTAISGAGPCLIAFANQNQNLIGEAMVQAFLSHGIKSYYLILNIDTDGAKIIS